MIEFTCPMCHTKFSAFSAEWQVQRQSPKKVCPKCGAKVATSFRLKVFLGWFTLFSSLSALAGNVLGPYGFSAFFVPGLLAALFFSTQLENER